MSGKTALSGGMLAWLTGCVWVKVQTCIWPSWCHCPDWFYLSGTGSPR